MRGPRFGFGNPYQSDPSGGGFHPIKLPHRCGGAAGDVEIRSQLTAGLNRLGPQQDSNRNAGDVAALLTKASELLSETRQDVSSEPPANSSASHCGDGCRALRSCSSALHGHAQRSARSPSAFHPTTKTSSVLRPPFKPSGKKVWMPQPQSMTRPSASDVKSAQSSRSTYFFESTFLSSLPVSAAKEACELPPAETCKPLLTPRVEGAALRKDDRPICVMVCCSGPQQQLIPAGFRRPSPRFDRRFRTASSQTRSAIAASPEWQPPVMQRPRTDDSDTACDRRGVPDKQPRVPQLDGLQPVEEASSKGLQQQRTHQNGQLHQGQRRYQSKARCQKKAKQAGVLRTMGSRLNSFFCPGGCVGSSNLVYSGRAALLAMETAHWQETYPLEPLFRPKTARKVTESASMLQPAFRAQRQDAASSAQSFNAAISSFSSDQASDLSDSEECLDKRKRNADQPGSSCLKSSPISPPVESARVNAKPIQKEIHEEGLESLLRTLDRRRHRRSGRPPKPHWGVFPAARCRIHTCEVACEVVSQEEESDVDEDDGGADGAVTLEAGMRPNQNQSNAFDIRLDSLPLSHSKERSQPKDTREMEISTVSCRGLNPRTRSEELIGSVAQSLLTLSENLQSYVQGIRSTVAELRVGSSVCSRPKSS